MADGCATICPAVRTSSGNSAGGEFEKVHAEALAALTEWVDQAQFLSTAIGGDSEQTMFGQLAAGMAYGLAALGEWTQARRHIHRNQIYGLENE